MTPDQTSLEAELRALRAADLDDSLLTRLEAAAEGSLTELTPEELRLESLLRTNSPAALAPEFMADLENIFSDVPFPMNEKIVLFPKGNRVQSSGSRHPMWAAAAVALIGATTALLTPLSKPAANIAGGTVPPSERIISAASDNLIPAGFNRGVSNVSDEGVVWKSDTQPHSLMRVEYVDKITLKDNNGRTYQVEQPRVRYMLVPARTD